MRSPRGVQVVGVLDSGGISSRESLGNAEARAFEGPHCWRSYGDQTHFVPPSSLQDQRRLRVSRMSPSSAEREVRVEGVEPGILQRVARSLFIRPMPRPSWLRTQTRYRRCGHDTQAVLSTAGRNQAEGAENIASRTLPNGCARRVLPALLRARGCHRGRAHGALRCSAPSANARRAGRTGRSGVGTATSSVLSTNNGLGWAP